ncbi:glucose-6-phosphate dehydrogenase [Marinobacter zhanjiangensis]|uniref:Glucose-6-phosphate 1-dehydrogenase n=1 Tax=Marinobacter zhanjiangensis TaxID=578215 RepID=A0ABQ3ASA0_9GAMM|nr:glucose-6-phosphate dehydrogenase [Marinobacter zhanjiangensis]GGY64621.1 glucose-6-phosphate 1-dehydrogenase [Marinobacter zhanjiangensis]
MVSPDTACDLILFGAMGDLASKKLFPALYQLHRAELLSPGTRILALARRDYTLDEARQAIRERLSEKLDPSEISPATMEAFLARVCYENFDFSSREGYTAMAQWRSEGPTENTLILYYATPPGLYATITGHLASLDCCDQHTRVVVEKPIGHDLPSSREFNDQLASVFREENIFRIDHYLGKETVQNLIALRFANNLFASQWDQNHISHIEITVAESVGIEGRWSYFDSTGQLRDMLQSHLLQLLCLLAMDPPSDLSSDSIRDEKVKVLKALSPLTQERIPTHLVRGQYTAGTADGRPVPGYLEEEGSAGHSDTETFVALKVEIENWRWAGVPFYIRTGKRLPEKRSEIIVHFKPAPHYIFDPDQKHLANNKLIIRLQPDEGMALQILTKAQGLSRGMRLRQGPLDLSFAKAFDTDRIPDAYERLLLEAMKGNQYLFVRRDEVEHAWRWIDQLLDNCEECGAHTKRYAAGTWGPVASIAMITRDDRSWYEDA